MTECTICQPEEEYKVVRCTHYGEHIVRLLLRPSGLHSIVRYRGAFFAESHTGDPNYEEVYARQVAYIRG